MCVLSGLDGTVLYAGQEKEPWLLNLLGDDRLFEQYEDYEEDEGELRAESTLAEKFGSTGFLHVTENFWSYTLQLCAKQHENE